MCEYVCVRSKDEKAHLQFDEERVAKVAIASSSKTRVSRLYFSQIHFLSIL